MLSPFNNTSMIKTLCIKRLRQMIACQIITLTNTSLTYNIAKWNNFQMISSILFKNFCISFIFIIKRLDWVGLTSSYSNASGLFPTVWDSSRRMIDPESGDMPSQF